MIWSVFSSQWKHTFVLPVFSYCLKYCRLKMQYETPISILHPKCVYFFFSLFSFIKILTLYHYACFCLHLTVFKSNLMAIVELTFFWSVLGLANIRVMFLKYSKKSCKKTKQNSFTTFPPKTFWKTIVLNLWEMIF